MALQSVETYHTKCCEYIYQEYGLSKREFQRRKSIVPVIERIIRTRVPNANVLIFGSMGNGFALEESDLDLFVDSNLKENDTIDLIYCALRDHNSLFDDVEKLPQGKVPLVKLHHKELDMNIDITARRDTAEYNTEVLKLYSEIDIRVKKLGIVFKHFMKLCDMAGDSSDGGLSPFTSLNLVIYYLQREKVVPVLQKTYIPGQTQEAWKIMEGSEIYYLRDISKLAEVWPSYGKNHKSLGELWVGLIHYYTKQFDFKTTVVTIRQGNQMTRAHKQWTRRKMCIEDPLSINCNLARKLSNEMFNNIMNKLNISRDWFLSKPDRPLGDDKAIYNHYMNPRKLTRN